MDIRKTMVLKLTVDGELVDNVQSEHEETLDVSDGRFGITGDLLNGMAEVNASYELGRKFAEGGQGELRKGEDRLLRRTVAIKSLKRPLTENEIEVKRFVAEAVITAQLDHPAIVPLYSMSRDTSNGLHMSMKLVDGVTLSEMVDMHREGACAETEIVQLRERLEHFIRVCDAMAYAHDKKLVHRDLKPQNVMVGGFHETYVMDWGVAHSCEVEDPDLAEGFIVGTPGYIAPEIAHGKPFMPVADQYAMGMLLFELVSLRSPFKGDTVKERLNNAINGIHEPLEHVCSDVVIHPDLRAICLKAISVRPESRYPDVAALGEDLRRFIEKREVSARPDNGFRRLGRWIAINRQLTAVIVLGFMLLSSVVAIQSLVKQHHAAALAQQRELKLLDLRSDMENRAHRIDRHFQTLATLLERYADKAVYLLEAGPQPDVLRQVVLYEKIADESQHPEETFMAKPYKQFVNLNYCSYSLGPEKKLAEYAESLQAVGPLVADSFHLMCSSEPEFDGQPDDIRRRHVIEKGVPIRWIYFGLPDGLLVNYPANGILLEDYDPRERPWYIQANGVRGVRWSAPYEDAFGIGTIISASIAMRNKDNKFMGVAAFDLTLQYSKDVMLEKGEGAVLATHLIDNDGKIVVSSNDGTRGNELGIPQIRDAISESRVGQFEIERDGRPLIISYAKIETLSWCLIQEVDIAEY